MKITNNNISKQAKHLLEIKAAMKLLGLNADELFRRIRRDLDRGLIDEARSHISFVDAMLED